MELYQLIINQAANALDEDVGSGDISANLIDAEAWLETELLVREDAVLCGCQWFDEVFRQCDEKISTQWHAGDGDQITANSVVCEVSGPARGLLTAERSALNFLQTLNQTYPVQNSRHAENHSATASSPEVRRALRRG
jgi:nicotinate-nucleotide pyrophosphorylase (carboxylating)